MSWLTLLMVALNILKGVLSAATGAKLPQEIIDGIQAAIASVESVAGLPVTKQQLEQLRVDLPFGGVPPAA